MKKHLFIAIALLLFFCSQGVAQTKPPAKMADGIIVVKARPLPLNSMRLLGGPLTNAQDLDATQMLELEPDRMMAFLRPRAGLDPKAKPLGGWDGAGRQLTGHIAEHYLSGVSMMCAATGDVRFKERADYLVQELKEVQEKQKKLEAATVVFAQPGRMQTERDFNLQGEDTSPVQLQGHYGRKGTKWFSFDLPVDPARPMAVIVTFSNDGPRRSFNVLVEGRKVGELALERRSPEQDIRFFDIEYVIPAELVKGKQKVTIRFEATNGNEISTVFGIRIVRADAAR
jgi:hypothetical protein